MTDRQFNQSDVEICGVTPARREGFLKINQVTVKHRLFRGDWSDPILREVLERGDAAAVLLYDSSRRVVALQEQFRIGAVREARPWLFEIVAGVIERDSTPADTAVREAEEEAGVMIDTLESINAYYPSPGGCSEKVFLFAADVRLGEGGVFGLTTENEDIRLSIFSYDQAFQMVAKGAILNANTLIALQWLKLKECSDR